MTITYPLDLLSDFPGWTTKFEPMLRQEQSRTAAGRTYTKDLGPSLWQLTAVSKPLKPNELDYWRARLNMLSDIVAPYDQATFAIGTSYRLTPTSLIKAEISQVRTGDVSSFIDAPSGGDSAHQRLNVFSLSYSFIF